MRLQHYHEGQIRSRDRRVMDQRSEGKSRIFKDFIVNMLRVMQKVRRKSLVDVHVFLCDCIHDNQG